MEIDGRPNLNILDEDNGSPGPQDEESKGMKVFLKVLLFNVAIIAFFLYVANSIPQTRKDPPKELELSTEMTSARRLGQQSSRRLEVQPEHMPGPVHLCSSPQLQRGTLWSWGRTRLNT